MNPKTFVLPALAGLLVPLLAACGSDGADAAGGGDAVVVGTTDTFTVTKDTPAPFDPAASYDIGAWNVLRNTFQTLLRLPRYGTEPVPDAATSCGFTDKGDQRYACTLRSGLTFSNGHTLDARDVAYSVRRMLRINYVNGPASLLSDVASVETVGSHRVVFRLRKPDATFPYKLATPAASIVDSETYPANGFVKGFRMTGSGPYVLKDWDTKGHQAVLAANPHYKGGLKLHNGKVVLRFFHRAADMEKALRSGGIDLMNRSIPPREVARLQAHPGDHLDLVEQPGQEIRYLVFNTDDRTAGQRAVRQAVARVVDRQALVRDVYSRTSEPLYSMVPSGLPGHRNSFFDDYGEPSAAAARRTLERAGVHTPVKLSLTYTSDHYGDITAEEFAELRKQLEASGLFEVTTKGVPWSRYRPAALKGEYQVYGYGWFPDFPDADNYIAPFFEKSNVLNSSYHNGEIDDRLIPRTRRQENRGATTASFGRAQDIVASDVPVLPLWQGKQYIAARDDITGAEWALNSSSVLRLWELGRGVDS